MSFTLTPLGDNHWEGHGSPEGKANLALGSSYNDLDTDRDWLKTSAIGSNTGWELVAIDAEDTTTTTTSSVPAATLAVHEPDTQELSQAILNELRLLNFYVRELNPELIARDSDNF